MDLDYSYKITKRIDKYLHKLEILKQAINLFPPFPHIEENLRRQSLLKSSLFSARIEGNKLKLEDLREINLGRTSKNIARLEILNIARALRFIYSDKAPKRLSINLILNLHKLVMEEISQEAGILRKECSAIFNKAGVAVYMTPPPEKIVFLLNKLLERINQKREPIPAKAALSHFAFEKIHPFLDGNGRVGRLVSVFILKKGHFDFRGLVSLEEYLENHREIYYHLLGEKKKDITWFIEFFLEGLIFQAEKAIEEIKNYREEKKEDTLLPRRREIFEIVRDHRLVSFDFIRRRFVRVPESSLHYDLKMLLKEGFIKKLGTTRGVIYTPAKGYFFTRKREGVTLEESYRTKDMMGFW